MDDAGRLTGPSFAPPARCLCPSQFQVFCDFATVGGAPPRLIWRADHQPAGEGRMRSHWVAVLGLVVSSSLMAPGISAQTSAQTWPQRTVKFVVPLGAGSGVDI